MIDRQTVEQVEALIEAQAHERMLRYGTDPDDTGRERTVDLACRMLRQKGVFARRALVAMANPEAQVEVRAA